MANITTRTIFNLFNDSNLAYVESITNNITVRDNDKAKKFSDIKTLTINPTEKPNNTVTGITIDPTPSLYIRRYSTLQTIYQISSKDNSGVSGVTLSLQGNSSELISPIVLDTTNTVVTSTLIYLTKNISDLKIKIIFKDASSVSGITISRFELNQLEGDQMVYEDENDVPVLNSTESTIQKSAVNTVFREDQSYSYFPISPSGIQSKYYMSIKNITEPETVEDDGGVTLVKSFPNVDYPDYWDGKQGKGLYDLLLDLSEYSSDLSSNINTNIPVGYNYLWQFIFNDITFTNVPSLELTGIYGNFNSSTYYDEDLEDSNGYYNVIMESGDHPSMSSDDFEDEYDYGFRIKLKIPAINESGIDIRNDKHYAVKKTTQLFANLHNSIFDYFYNNVTISGVTVSNHMVENFIAPTIQAELNPKTIFEFIRKHTILHYQHMIIYDILERYCDSKDVTSYLETQDCTISGDTVNNTLSVEFVEILRLLCQFDQNILMIDPCGTPIRKYDLYDTPSFLDYDRIGSSISGIDWAWLFKCQEGSATIQTQFSKLIAPFISVSRNGISMFTDRTTYSPMSSSGIADLNPYYYFSNIRMRDMEIASGQHINKTITDANGDNICVLNPEFLKGADNNTILEDNNYLKFTPLSYYILFESYIYTRGYELSKNGVASNLLLKNIIKCFNNSLINYISEYKDTTPIILDLFNGSIATSEGQEEADPEGSLVAGQILMGNLDENFNIITKSNFLMRDIIAAATTTNYGLITHGDDELPGNTYYIFVITNILNPNIGTYVTFTENATQDVNIYISKNDYIRLKGFGGSILYTVIEDEKYLLHELTSIIDDNMFIYSVTLRPEYEAEAVVSILDDQLNLIFYTYVTSPYG